MKSTEETVKPTEVRGKIGSMGTLAELTEHSPRLPSAVRDLVFDAVFDIVEKFNFPCQNASPRADVVEIGDVCGEVEKRIVAILRAESVRALL